MLTSSHLLFIIILFTLTLHGIAQDAEPYIITSPTSTCGFSKSPRIVGGVDATPGEFPWMVANTAKVIFNVRSGANATNILDWGNGMISTFLTTQVSLLLNGNHYCGGALIYQHWVLTAAHCVQRHSKNTLKVRVGEFKLSERTDQEKDIAIDTIIVHPDFVLARYLNDLALLHLAEKVIWDETKQPICLPMENNTTYVGEEVTVAGWGWLDEPEKGGSRSNVLQKLTMKVIDRQVCQSWYHEAGKYVTINANHMCAGFKDGTKDSCHGDSGGPLMQKDGSQYSLVGIVSAGIGCARPLLPGLYTRVNAYLSWISENTKD